MVKFYLILYIMYDILPGGGAVGSLVTYGRIFKPGHNSMVEHKKHVFLCEIERGFQKKLESMLKLFRNALILVLFH